MAIRPILTEAIKVRPMRTTIAAGGFAGVEAIRLRPVAWVGGGSVHSTERVTTQYEVEGLPGRERAWLANFGAS